MVAAKMVIGTIEGVDRPALATVLPNLTGHCLLLDVGANPDLKTPHFKEFAVMGSIYAELAFGKKAPSIGLMSIGEEDSKGTEQTKEVFKTLKATGLNFIGNVEGRDVFNGTVDVIVTDGFTGNVILKVSESLSEMVETAPPRGDQAHAPGLGRVPPLARSPSGGSSSAWTTPSTAARRCSGSRAASSSATAAPRRRRSRTPSASRRSSRAGSSPRRSRPQIAELHAREARA